MEEKNIKILTKIPPGSSHIQEENLTKNIYVNQETFLKGFFQNSFVILCNRCGKFCIPHLEQNNKYIYVCKYPLSFDKKHYCRDCSLDMAKNADIVYSVKFNEFYMTDKIRNIDPIVWTDDKGNILHSGSNTFLIYRYYAKNYEELDIYPQMLDYLIYEDHYKKVLFEVLNLEFSEDIMIKSTLKNN